MPDPSTPKNDASLRAGPTTNDTSLRARWAREVRTRLSPLRLSPVREAEIVDELSQHLDDWSWDKWHWLSRCSPSRDR